MTSIYEQIGRRVVELYSTSAQFARQPNKGTDGKKPKCKPTSHSCGFSCISGKKTCRITMTMEQQQAAKKLKAELRGQKKAEGDKPAKTGSQEIESENVREQREYLKNGGVKDDLLPVLKILSPNGMARMSIAKSSEQGVVSYGGAFIYSDGKGNIEVRYKQGATDKQHTETWRAVRDAAKEIDPRNKVAKTFKRQSATEDKSKATSLPIDESTKPTIDRVMEANPGLKPMEAGLKAKAVDRLEGRLADGSGSEADRAYRDALLKPADPDSSEAALDRINNLFAARNKLAKGELSARDLEDVASDFKQGLRGGSVQEINEAAAKYTAEIWSGLSPAQRGAFAEAWIENTSGDRDISTALAKSPGFQKALKARDVDKFRQEADKEIQRKLKERNGGDE